MKKHQNQTDGRLPQAEMQRSFRLWFHLSLIVVLLLMADRARSEEVRVADRNGQAWTIEVTPISAATESRDLPVPAPLFEETALLQGSSGAAGIDVQINPDSSPLAMVNGATYRDVYDSIPYSRTEYLANPGYRHEAAMEILFGQLRPTTIHKQYEPRVIENIQYGPYQSYPFAHWDYGQTSTLLRPRLYYQGWCDPWRGW